MEICEKFEMCGFVEKYGSSNHIDCRGFINAYCKGTRMEQCARLEYYRKNNAAPSNDMLPSGKIINCEESFVPYNENKQQYY